MVKIKQNLDYSARPPVVNRRSHRVATSANWIVSRVEPRSPIQRWKSPREINVDSNLVPVIILICKGELKDTWIMHKWRKKSKRWFGKTLKLQHLNWISATKVTKPPWHTKPNTFFFGSNLQSHEMNFSIRRKSTNKTKRNDYSHEPL